MKNCRLTNTRSNLRRVPTVLLSAGAGITLLLSSPIAIGQDSQVEEVVVTGSFIRRSEGFTQASQVTQLTAEDLEAEGTMNIGEVVQNLAFVNGSASAITNSIQGTDSRSSSVDLRGLGARSTLTLLDGKRLVNQNVNALVPTIALQRLDIVADGAAALYGNEAVAGVVNFVPYKSYDGLRVETYAEGDSKGDYDEHSVQVLWGGVVGEIDVVLAGQFRSNSRLGWDERPEHSQSGLTFSSNAPGNWLVSPRGPDGQYTGEGYVNTPDPACAPAAERRHIVAGELNNPYGMRRGSTCYWDFSDLRSYRDPMDTSQFYANATWEANEDLTLSLQGFRTRLYEVSYGSTASSGGQNRIPELPIVRGELPGNPFRSVDGNGNLLFGSDSNGDGVPDRQPGVDLNNDGLEDYVVSGLVDNGVPLFEDVVPRRIRPLNKTMGMGGQAIAGLAPQMDRLDNSTDRISRWTMQADFTLPFVEGWEGMAAYSSNYREREMLILDNYDIRAMIQGLNCDVVNDRDSCYNPFFVTNPANATRAHVVEAILALDSSAVEDKLDVIDIVVNGELPLGGFELPGGRISAAIGYQNRQESFKNTPAVVGMTGDAWIGQGDLEPIVSGGRDIDAFFAEFAVPVLPTLELELAVRREEFSSGQESTDPKFGVTWTATDWLTFRATHGEAFIAPTPEQLFNPETCGLLSIDDPFGPFNSFGTACQGGNPRLRNEQSKSQQLGFDLVFQNFDIHVTWNKTEFENRIVTTLAQQIVDLDFFNFQKVTGFSGPGEPNREQVAAWISNPASDPRVVRSTDDVFDIALVRTGASNAETVLVEAIDIQASYELDLNNAGALRFGLQATFLDEWQYQENPTRPVIDGVGRLNSPTGTAPALPELKANLRIGWSRGNHNVVTTTRYIDSLSYDGPNYHTFVGLFPNTFADPTILDTGVKAWTDMDIAYTYRGLNLFDGELALTLGSRNVFDREAQRTPDFAGVIAELQDPLGRILYGRLVYDF